MNYKLAKQLKDAGFPQKFRPTDIFYNHKKELLAYGAGWYRYKVKYKVPTLEELIDACGDEFYILRRINKESWVAEWRDGPCFVCKTPLEAVAKLYIKLNK